MAAAISLLCAATAGAEFRKPLPPALHGVQWFFGGSAEVDTTDDLGAIVSLESADKVVTYEVFDNGRLFRSKRYGAIVSTAASGQPLSWVEQLGVDFYVDTGDMCRDRAPRFGIALDVNLDREADTWVYAHLGSTEPDGACDDGWNSRTNLIADDVPRFELPGFSWLATWETVLAYLGQGRVHSIWFEVDAQPLRSTQGVKVSTLTINQHCFTASKAIKYFAEIDESRP
jgi:hypothetical protein